MYIYICVCVRVHAFMVVQLVLQYQVAECRLLVMRRLTMSCWTCFPATALSPVRKIRVSGLSTNTFRLMKVCSIRCGLVRLIYVYTLQGLTSWGSYVCEVVASPTVSTVIRYMWYAMDRTLS